MDLQPTDIPYILAHPWQVTRQEWKLHLDGEVERVSRHLANRLARSTESGVARIWRTAEGEPIGILGCYPVKDRTYESVFIASEHMDRHAGRVTREMRRMLRDTARELPGCECVLYSASAHPKQIAWFRFLGFEHLPEKDAGGVRCFRYAAADPMR